jgi:hypothetical protein
MAKEEEGYEETLSFVSLTLDNRRLLLNDKPQYAVDIPRHIRRKKISYEKRLLLKDLICAGCEKFNVDWHNLEKLQNCASNILDQMADR